MKPRDQRCHGKKGRPILRRESCLADRRTMKDDNDNNSFFLPQAKARDEAEAEA